MEFYNSRHAINILDVRINGYRRHFGGDEVDGTQEQLKDGGESDPSYDRECGRMVN